MRTTTRPHSTDVKCSWSVSIALLMLLASVFAAEFWEQKPYTEWTEKECLNLLTRSPWVLEYTTGEYGPSNYNRIYFRFVTSQPIKMAMARLRLLQEPNSDALWSQVQEYVDAPPANEILVEVNVSGDRPGNPLLRELERFFQVVELPKLQRETYLASSDRDIRVPLSDYVKPGTRTRLPMYVFPRFDETGKPYFTGQEESIVFHTELDLGNFEPVGRVEALSPKKPFYEVNYRMNTKKLVFKGQFTL